MVNLHRIPGSTRHRQNLLSLSVCLTPVFSPRAGGCYVNSDSAHYQPLRSELELTGFGPGRGQLDPTATMGSVCVCMWARMCSELITKCSFISKSHPEATVHYRGTDTQCAMTSTAYFHFHSQTPLITAPCYQKASVWLCTWSTVAQWVAITLGLARKDRRLDSSHDKHKHFYDQ